MGKPTHQAKRIAIGVGCTAIVVAVCALLLVRSRRSAWTAPDLDRIFPNTRFVRRSIEWGLFYQTTPCDDLSEKTTVTPLQDLDVDLLHVAALHRVYKDQDWWVRSGSATEKRLLEFLANSVPTNLYQTDVNINQAVLIISLQKNIGLSSVPQGFFCPSNGDETSKEAFSTFLLRLEEFFATEKARPDVTSREQQAAFGFQVCPFICSQPIRPWALRLCEALDREGIPLPDPLREWAKKEYKPFHPLSDFGYAFTVAFADGTPPEGLCLVSPSWNPNEPRKWADATLFLPSGTPKAKAVLAELTPLPVKANHSLPDSRISLFAWFPSAPTNATAPPVLETRVLDEPYSAKNVTRKVLKIFELLAPEN